MSDTFMHMSLPWWELVLRAVIVYFLVMLLLRASGKRAVGQFTPFDMVLLILIGNAVQNGMNGGDNSLPGAVLLCLVLIGLNYGVAYISSRNRKVQELVEGVPVLLARNGKVFEDVLPGATLTILPGLGHIPQIEDPAAFNDALLKALGKL